jgi:hypothetical protein
MSQKKCDSNFYLKKKEKFKKNVKFYFYGEIKKNYFFIDIVVYTGT